MSILSDARLNRDYTSKVIQALSLSGDSHTLIRRYIRTVKPLLTEPDDIDAYTIALAESSLLEAWSYQRSFSEVSDTRKRLVRKILDWCLTREYFFNLPSTPRPQQAPCSETTQDPSNTAARVPFLRL